MKPAVLGLFSAIALMLSAQVITIRPNPPQNPSPASGQPQGSTPSQQKASPKESTKEGTPKPAEPAPPPAPPRAVQQSGYSYDVNGQPSAGPVIEQRRREIGTRTEVDRTAMQPNINGGAVPAVTSEQRTVSQGPGNETSERVIQRYDPEGRPTTKQVVKIEKRTLPDGTVTSTESVYEQDVNHNLQFVEKRTATEKKTAAGGSSTVMVERPSINGSMQVVERTDRTDTKRSETVTESVSSRRFADINGQLAERDREQSVATKQGAVTNTDTKQWQVGATGQMDFVSETTSRLTQKPDGSQVEDSQVYSTRIAGTTPDLNTPYKPTLESETHRETMVQPSGKIVETTTSRLRGVADPTSMTGLVKTEQVTTPTSEGKTIQTTLYERDANGKMVRTRSEVQEEKK